MRLETLNSFLHSLEEGVVFLDANRRVVSLNSAAEQMLGLDAGRAVQSLCPTLFNGTDCARACSSRGSCSLTPRGGQERKVQDLTLRRLGQKIVLRMWALLLPPNEEGLYCSIILRDRTREAALEDEVRERWRLGGLVGRSPAMQALYAEILRAAGSEANVLITGESGVGKELVARALHDNSPRSKGPFVPLHCAALPENLLESELFGHAKGAFSGAVTQRIGRFEAADRGTLLLDEVGELSPATQTKLLRVLQEREIVRLGENKARRIDVRVLAATHRDVGMMVAAGSFREDLYYRLCVLPLHVPPLRERIEDLPLLAGKILQDLGERYQRPDLQLAPQTLAVMERNPWPGNVRQLANMLEYALVHSAGRVISPDALPRELRAPAGAAVAATVAPVAASLGPYYRRAPGEDEQAVIRRALAEAGGNRTEAARRLGMSRTTLWKRLKDG